MTLVDMKSARSYPNTMADVRFGSLAKRADWPVGIGSIMASGMTATPADTAQELSPMSLGELGTALSAVASHAAIWLKNHSVGIVIALMLASLIFAALALVRRWAVRRARSAADALTVTDIFVRVIAKTRTVVMAIVAVRSVADVAAPPALVLHALTILCTVAVVVQAAIWLREILLGFVRRRAEDSETLNNAMGIIRLLISVALFAIAAIVILDNLGVNVTGLIAGLGIGGIAIGLAAQGIFSDLFAALSIIFDRPFRNGEVIKWDNTIATVERIGLKSTRLRSINGELLVVSNTYLLGKEISNFAHLSRRRVQLLLGVVYHTTPAQLRALPSLLERQIVDAGHEFVRSSLTGFGASSIDFELIFDVHSDDYNLVAAARSDVGVRLFEAMHAAGYAFAYPAQITFTAEPDGTLVSPWPPSAKQSGT